MNNKEKFEEWFQQQSFYLNLRFIHGDRLFASENGVYQILAVQIGWEAWQEQQKRIDELQEQFVDLKEDIDLQEFLYQGDAYNRGWNSALLMVKEKLKKLISGGEE